MRNDKEKATFLRHSGKSYRQIQEEMSVPRSTLSAWFGGQDWSQKIRARLSADQLKASAVRMRELDRVRGANLKMIYEEARSEAREEFEKLKYHPLFVSGLMLYWGEGTKNPRTPAKIANTDPVLLSLYMLFLTGICRVPIAKIKAHVLIYPDLDEKTCRAYWSKKTGIPWTNFTKSVTIKGRHPSRRLNWGVCIIHVSSLYFKQKMLEWLRILPSELMKREYYENIASESARSDR